MAHLCDLFLLYKPITQQALVKENKNTSFVDQTENVTFDMLALLFAR